MNDLPAKAFLSCNFSETDRDINGLFQRLLGAFHIIPELHEWQNVGPLTRDIEEHVKGTDCLVAIVTRGERLGSSERWTFSDWVHDEIAIARAFGKPIALFVEDGVRLGGSLSSDVRRQEFSRNNLLDSMPGITAFLFNLRQHLDQVMNPRSPLAGLKLVRDLIRVRERFAKEYFILTCEIGMQSLVSELPGAYHTQVLFDASPGLSIRPRQFEFECSERPADVKVSAKTLQSSDRNHVWMVAFDPPLKEQQRVRYGFRCTYKNEIRFTLEELAQRIEEGTYPTPEARCRALDWTITYPTRELTYELEFPAKYGIADPQLDVRIGSMSHILAEEEILRLRKENALIAEKVFDTWRIRLQVRNPLFGHNYAVSYVPPKSTDFPPEERSPMN